jgi:23S rRNA (guanosine2251-2'-O)-methyltransferase
MINDELIIEGKNSVIEVLNNSDQIKKIFISKNYRSARIDEIVLKASKLKLDVCYVDKCKLDALSETGKHQGVICVCYKKKYSELDDVLNRAKIRNQVPFVIILDKIIDPRNFGAIIRTAETCGVHGIIISKFGSVGLTSAVAKTSCGALEHVLVVRASNLVCVINELKRNNFWIFAADMSGETVYKTNLKVPLAIVIGSEGDGIRRLVLKNCDFKIKIPMYGKIKSLNASVAAGIFMYEVMRQRNL